MTEFLRTGMRVEQIPAFLTESVTGFKESLEHQELRAYEHHIPAVVCGAFAKYICRIAWEQFAEGSEPDISASISSAHAAMDVMAASASTAVQSLLTDEVFENLACDTAVLEAIKRSLKPNAAALYAYWMARLL